MGWQGPWCGPAPCTFLWNDSQVQPGPAAHAVQHHRAQPLFCQGQKGTILGFAGHTVSGSYSALQLDSESSQTGCVNKGVWLCCNKTLFTKTTMRLHASHAMTGHSRYSTGPVDWNSQGTVCLAFNHGVSAMSPHGLGPLWAPKSLPKESACNTGDPGFNPWVRKISWRRKWQPIRYSCLENSMDRGAWRALVHGVARVRHSLATTTTIVIWVEELTRCKFPLLGCPPVSLSLAFQQIFFQTFVKVDSWITYALSSNF